MLVKLTSGEIEITVRHPPEELLSKVYLALGGRTELEIGRAAFSVLVTSVQEGLDVYGDQVLRIRGYITEEG